MDVRCERCSTEYELDDDSVPDAGCPVQCTTCSHTFMVTRRGVASAAAAQPASESLPSPPAAEWLLETSDGRLHRFRNLTSLQKWIIERKVTREDKISRTGQSWRRLGEIVELAPFFDVVDEADRARAGQAGNDELKAEAQRARNLGSSGRLSPVPPRPVVPSAPPPVASRPLPSPTHSQELSALDSWAARGGESSGFEADSETSVVPLRRRGPKFIVAFFVTVGVVAGGLVLYQRQNDKTAATESESLALLAPADEVLPKAAAGEAPSVAAKTQEAAKTEPVASAPTPPEVVPTTPVAAATGARAATASSDDAGPGYESALAQADRLLENGGTEKAFKLYEKALKLRPDGAEALAGLGYVMLDKDRAGPAVSYFEKALAQAPSFGPAVFGMGEALRASGQESRALEMYRRYLQINGSGSDGPAARRQASLLEDKLKAKAGREEAPPAREEANMPAAGPPPSASSVLNEPASP